MEMVHLQKVDQSELGEFRTMVEAYWQELMPQPDLIRDARNGDEHLRRHFFYDGEHQHPRWAVVGEYRVGFLAFSVNDKTGTAVIKDFYVVPAYRRRGYGTAMVRALSDYFNELGVEQVDLNVRRDNPAALAFWEAQGFRIALYRLRQYRDPESGRVFVGALSSDFSQGPSQG